MIGSIMLDQKKPAGPVAIAKLGAIWCSFMHDSPMWPIHGEYRCRRCGRQTPVGWAGGAAPPRTKPAVTNMPTQSFPSALLPVIVIAAMLMPSRVTAAEASVTGSERSAAVAFARYVAGSPQNAPWDAEIIDIEASLPRLDRQGHLRAVRHLQFGRPQYQSVKMGGDETVKQQVILRYLTAEAKAAQIPASSIAVTPLNYKFSLKGVRQTDGSAIYCFSVRPRKKLPGLIKGELWIDEAGAVVRQSGNLVKNPSIFVKRITVTRETVIRRGLAEDRVTHVSVDTRLVGRAELIVHEYPCSDSACGTPRLVGE